MSIAILINVQFAEDAKHENSKMLLEHSLNLGNTLGYGHSHYEPLLLILTNTLVKLSARYGGDLLMNLEDAALYVRNLRTFNMLESLNLQKQAIHTSIASLISSFLSKWFIDYGLVRSIVYYEVRVIMEGAISSIHSTIPQLAGTLVNMS